MIHQADSLNDNDLATLHKLPKEPPLAQKEYVLDCVPTKKTLHNRTTFPFFDEYSFIDFVNYEYNANVSQLMRSEVFDKR